MEHALRPEGERNRGAGLGVGRFIWQIVGLGEPLVRFPRYGYYGQEGGTMVEADDGTKEAVADGHAWVGMGYGF